MGPLRGDIVVESRRVPFIGTIPIRGIDISGLACRMQARPQAGQTGPALLQIYPGNAGEQGISIAYDQTLYNPVTGGLTGGSVMTIQINLSTLNALDFAALGVPPDEPLVLTYDLLITQAGVERLFARGSLVIFPGVTI